MEDMPKTDDVFQRGDFMEVKCDHAQFMKIQRLICEEIGIAATDNVKRIYVGDESHRPPAAPSRGRDRIALIGCGIIALIFLFVLSAGITQIASWWWPKP
jgi:hypothetical protein